MEIVDLCLIDKKPSLFALAALAALAIKLDTTVLTCFLDELAQQRRERGEK